MKHEMIHIIRRFTLLLLIGTSTLTGAETIGTADSRISLNLTADEKARFLGEMRQMLASLQGVIAGIAEEDRELIIKSARYSGNRMARETPESIKQKTTIEFKAIGGKTHLMFEELAIRAETDDMDWLTSFTGDLMKQCLACHEIFKAN